MESLVGNRADVVHLNNHKISTLAPELKFNPFLAKLFIQENNSLPMLPPSFFQYIPGLLVLDLSHTSIQSLPQSISKLCYLEEFILRDCSLLIELPPEIGALKNLKLFDLEGTEIMYLPKEIGGLESLERLRVSLSTYADDHKDRTGIQHIIPRMTILKLTKLKELSISVSPEAEWWEVELLEAIMGDLLFLPYLKTLKLYLPTAKALQQFLRLERYKIPIYSNLCNYRFMTGHCEQLPFSVQLDIEEDFLKLEKCVKYMNGEGYADEMVDLIRDARALYLRRHWTIEKLSMFDIRRLKYCLLMECNEMQTLIDQEDFYNHKNKSTNHCEDEILGSLQYLSIHFLKKLQKILKGPIGRNSLSCLRILALHTCPELTSIFTECLLDNLQSLTEIVVEDCPKVNCLVKLEEGAPWRSGPFLPNLRRVSLLDLPELVSISGGVSIAPQLDTLLVFNCMQLDHLSVMEIPRGTMAIKGEIEWWDALKYGKLTWESVFVQLKRDGTLMDQLAEDKNSLQHFHELEMVPSLRGKVNQNSSRNINEGREHAYQLQIDHNADLSNQTQKMLTHIIPDDDYIQRYLQDISYDLSFPRKHSGFRRYKNSKHQMEVSKRVVSEDLNDGYIWRKYGKKDIFGDKYPRTYYRCNFKSTSGCHAKKHVKRSTKDPSVFDISYWGHHTCETVFSKSSSTATESSCTSLRTRDSSTATESASIITDSHFELAKRPQVLDSNKKNSTSTRFAKWTDQLKVSPNTVFDTPADDGYVWRKYGQRDISGAKYSIAYYRCYHCNAKKRIQRFDDDPSNRIVTYKGIHTCLRLSVISDSTCESESSLSILQSSDSSATYESELSILKNNGSSVTSESTSTITDSSFGLKFTKKMSGSASIQRWKQQMEETQSPSLKYQLPSSHEPNQMIPSEVMENGSRKLSLSTKTSQNAKHPPSPALKVRKEKMGDKITALQQLVSPFGKTDTATVLLETCEYIRFLHAQVEVLLTPYTRRGTTLEPQQQAPKQDLRSQRLCLVPVSSTFPITNQTTTDFSSLIFEEKPPDEPNAYKAEELFP